MKKCKRCKKATWTCWACGEKCCEHLCSLKKNDGTAICGNCKHYGFHWNSKNEKAENENRPEQNQDP